MLTPAYQYKKRAIVSFYTGEESKMSDLNGKKFYYVILIIILVSVYCIPTPIVPPLCSFRRRSTLNE